MENKPIKLDPKSEEEKRKLKDALGKRWSSLKKERQPWMGDWKACSSYLLPRTGRFLADQNNLGAPSSNLIYDNTGTHAVRVLAAGMLSGMTSPARPWFRLSIEDDDLAQYHSVRIWLAEVTRRMQWMFSQSNVYRVLHGMYEELGVYGTASCTLLDDYQKGIHLYAHTAGEYALATNFKGQVDTQYRNFKKSVISVVREFGLENVSEFVRTSYDRGNYDVEVEIIHAVEPRSDRDPTKLDSKNMAWRSTYFEAGNNKDLILRDSGFKQFRTLAPRWTVTGQDTYGTSPGMEVLGDVKQLQHAQLRKSQAHDNNHNPSLQGHNSLKHADRRPGGMTFTDGDNHKFERLFDPSQNISEMIEDIRDIRERIRQGMFTDMFLMLANGDNGRMTATEVAERHEEKLLMLGPVLERLHNELLSPLIEISFERMVAAQWVPEAPEELQGTDLQIDFVSMLAQAQKAVGLNSSDRFVSSLLQVGQFKPGVYDKFNEDKWADTYADSLGVDPALINSDEEVEAIRQERMAQQQAAAQQQQAAQLADSAAKLGKVDTSKPNGMTDIMQNLTGYGSPAPYNI